ncbi:MAG: hypothetical protein R3E79_47700 [Caldilineaceae bacterium]
MEFQSLFPPAIDELATAAGLTALLLGLLWLIGRLVPALGDRLRPAIRTTTTIVLQALLFVGGVIFTSAFAGVTVAWLLLALATAFGVGAGVYGRQTADQPHSDLSASVHVPPVTPSSLTTSIELPPAAEPELVGEPEPVVEAPAADLHSSAEPLVVAVVGSEPVAAPSTVVDPAVDEVSPLSSAAIVADTAVPVAPEEPPVDTDEQSFFPLALPLLRPWQHRVPAPLLQRRALGKQTIRSLFAN